MPPISSKVVRALRILGVRNAGTPLATASTPVRAEHPLEKARRRRRMIAACATPSDLTAYWADSATGANPSAVRMSAVTIMTAIDPMKT